METNKTFLAIAAALLAEVACFGQSILWSGNGDGTSWSDQNNWVGLQVPGNGNNVIITNGTGSNVVISSSVTVESVLCTKPLSLTNGNLTVTAGTSSLQGALSAPAGSALDVTGRGTTFIASGPANISGSDLSVTGGALLSLPGVVNYQPPTYCNEFVWQVSGAGSVLSLPALTNITGNTLCAELSIQASSGGQVLLPNAAADLGGDLMVQSDGSNSLVNFSALAANAGTLSLEASGGGSVLVPRLRSSGILSLNLGAGGSIPTAQFTNITGANLSASGGAVLSLPDVVNYQPPGGCEAITWQASGTGSVVSLPALTNVTGNTNCAELTIHASSGGQLLVTNAAANLGGVLVVLSDGSNSVVNLSSLAGNAGTLSLEASGGGSLLVPRLRNSGILTLTLNAGGSIPTAQFTNISGASLYANGGSVLSLPAAANYQPPGACEAITWEASGTGSVVSLPALTNVTGNTVCAELNIQAANGGQVLVTNATLNLAGTLTAEADGSNSVVNLSALTANAGTLSLEASAGGSLLVPRLDSGGTISLNLGAGGFISTAQFTNITGANLLVTGGAVLSLPAVVSYQPPPVCDDITWQASGSNSVLSLPALTNVTGNVVCGQLTVEALSGAQVSLNHVTTIDNGSLSILSSGTNSVIDLSQMSGMVLATGQGSLMAQNGGTILLNTQAFLLGNVAINIPPGNPILPPTLIQGQALTLYGTPWHSYKVQEQNTLIPGSPWTTFYVPLTNSFQVITPTAPANTAFTVTDFVPNPALLEFSLQGASQLQFVLFGLTNAIYQIQASTNLPGTWTPFFTVTMTNSFRFLPETPVTAAKQFFQVKQEL
jgi:hypothetical protein